MGQPTHLPIRERISSLRAEGHTFKYIAQEVGLSFWTVRQLLRRAVKRGILGNAPDYAACGGGGRLRSEYFLFRVCCWLKRRHPTWGAPLIHLALSRRYGGKRQIPSICQMQRWFRQQGLNQPRPRKGEVRAGRAEAVHECWQVDAKERLVLANGQVCCYLSVVDEYSGAALGARLFPLLPNQPTH